MAVTSSPIDRRRSTRVFGSVSSRVSGRVSSRVFGTALAAACLALLAVQLRDVDFGVIFANVDPGWVIAAVAAFAISLGLAAHNISAFAPIRLRAADTVRAQLAVGALRVVAPSAITTPAVGARFLTRSGVGAATSLTVVATAQSAQLVMTVAVVAVIAAVGASGVSLPHPEVVGAVAGGLVLLVAVALLLARHWTPVARAVHSGRCAVRDIAGYLRRHPRQVLTGLAASAGLTLAHVTAFACCVHAVGGDASVLALTAVYLGASGAGSLVPTPGGIGAVEAALISGLVAAGLSPGTATAAALLTRLVTVWAPAAPGWWALRSLRRAQLL